jgi:hypothetical protein
MSHIGDLPQAKGKAAQQTFQPFDRVTQAARGSRAGSVLQRTQHTGQSQLLVPVKLRHLGYYHVLHHDSAPRENNWQKSVY